MSTTGTVSGVNTYDPDATKYAKTEQSSDEMRTDFLKMLTAQLEYQDPLEPLENTEFTAQMAQFSALGEQQKSNELLQNLVNQLSTSGINQAVSYIGRQVLLEGNKAQVTEGQGDLRFELSDAATVKVNIFDENGSMVKTIEPKRYKNGEQNVALNSPGDDIVLPDGTYSFKLEAMDAPESLIMETLEYGMVTGVTNSNSGVKLDVNGRDIDVADIRRVELAPS